MFSKIFLKKQNNIKAYIFILQRFQEKNIKIAWTFFYDLSIPILPISFCKEPPLLPKRTSVPGFLLDPAPFPSYTRPIQKKSCQINYDSRPERQAATRTHYRKRPRVTALSVREPRREILTRPAEEVFA
jgi:hypothetical protein